MKYEVELDGQFEADINFWNGKASLVYEGNRLDETDKKNVFLLGDEKIAIGGTLFSGVYLVRGEKRVLLIKLYWYDYLASILPFIVGLIGGVIGAVLGVVAFILAYKIMPYIKPFILRLLMCIGFAAAVFGIVLLLFWLFPGLFGGAAAT